MALGKWFDEDFFAGQKLAQMGVLGQTVPTTGTNVQKLQAVIDAYNSAENANVTIESNFKACNQSGYITSVVDKSAINVSPNALFDVRYYLTALAENANETGYTADGIAAGGWTAENVLQTMYNSGYSAWTHFMNDGLDRMIDCSSSFNTKAYLEDKAAATDQTVEQVIAQMKAAGLNPVMDYFENGQDLGIELKPVTTPLTVTMPVNGQWIESSVTPPEETDPYEEIAANVAIEAGNDGPYEGKDGVNTQFDAVYSKVAGATTLAATDVITGGADAHNTLAVSLGNNWGGFKGIDTGVMGKSEPNVTNVGRVVLNREESSSEQTFTFSAKNISEDTERFDINAAGTGATNLTDLSDGVREVNISGLKAMNAGSDSGKIQGTNLKFVSTANAGSDDVLTIGLTNTGSAKAAAPVTWNTGIETVVINSKGDAANAIDITAATGVKEVDIKGAADIQVQTTATNTLKTYDMHEATGKVTLNAYGLSNQTIIGGQSTEDTVNLGSSGLVTAKDWTGIENVTFGATNAVKGGTTFNAKGAEGIKSFWIANANNEANKVTNLAADDITVYQTRSAAGTKATTTIDGTMTKGDSSLGNITWQSQTGEDEPTAVKALFESNAGGTATIKLMEQDYLDDASSFKFSNASKVVFENGVASKASYTSGVTFEAPNATDLQMTVVGALTLHGAKGTELGKVQNLTLNLEDTSDTPDSFNMGFFALASAQNVTVDGGGEDVSLGDLGTATGSNATPVLNLDVSNVNNFTVGDMGVGLGSNIQAVIDAEGAVTIGDVTSSTNSQSNVQGDVYLKVNGDSVSSASGVTIAGGELNIDFSGVEGGVGAASKVITLASAESITYTGADGVDSIKVTNVGGGTTSDISTGAGADEITFDFTGINFSKATTGATINVDLGAGDGVKDEITFSGGPGKGVVRVNVSSFEGSDSIDATSLSAIKDGIVIGNALEAVGLSRDLVSGFNSLGNDGKYYDASSGTAYGVAGTYIGADPVGVTVIVVTGVQNAGCITLGSAGGSAGGGDPTDSDTDPSA